MISVRFLGTAGARFMVAKQIRASGGHWYTFSGDAGTTQIHVDPGPGALVRATSAVPPCDPVELDAIALSHKHLDHSGDVNVMIEAMTVGGFRPRGALLAPLDAYEGEAVIFPYAARFVPVRHVLEEKAGPYIINDVEIRTSINLVADVNGAVSESAESVVRSAHDVARRSEELRENVSTVLAELLAVS